MTIIYKTDQYVFTFENNLYYIECKKTDIKEELDRDNLECIQEAINPDIYDNNIECFNESCDEFMFPFLKELAEQISKDHETEWSIKKYGVNAARDYIEG